MRKRASRVCSLNHLHKQICDHTLLVAPRRRRRCGADMILRGDIFNSKHIVAPHHHLYHPAAWWLETNDDQGCARTHTHTIYTHSQDRRRLENVMVCGAK